MTAAAQGIEPTLSPEDVAALTGLHYQSVLAEIRAGALRAKKIRGRYLITKGSYDAWLAPDVPERAVFARTPPPASSPPSRTVAGVGSVARLKALEGGGAG